LTGEELGRLDIIFDAALRKLAHLKTGDLLAVTLYEAGLSR